MMAATIEPNDADRNADKLRLRDWLWRPWYAKLWWSGVPVYWLGMLATLKLHVLADVYRSAAAGYLNIFFFPPLVALILSFGFFRAWLVRLNHFAGIGALDENCLFNDKYGPSGMPWEFDPLDPRSGAFWIGNPLNPLNSSNINRVS